jgi:hypothetical protein
LGLTCGLCEGREEIELSLSLDDSVYLSDQPILTIITAKNAGDVEFRDLAPLYPGDRFIDLRLTNMDSGKPVSFAAPRPLSGYTAEGLRLQPGESELEAINLQQWFGRRVGDGIAARLGAHSLLPGSYRLDATFHARIGAAVHLPAILSVSHPAYFKVVPIETAPSEVHLVNDFLRDCPADWMDIEAINRYCAAQLSRFLHSKYLVLVYYQSGPGILKVPIDSLMHWVDPSGRGTTRAAYLIGLRSKTEHLGTKEKLEWLNNLRLRRQDDLSRRVIDSWIRRLGQYGSGAASPR